MNLNLPHLLLPDTALSVAGLTDYIQVLLEQDEQLRQVWQQTQPTVSKNVVYAFPTLKDATIGSGSKDPQIMMIPIPVMHILFQMVAMQTVDSIVFFENSGDLEAGVEVSRQELQNLIHFYLQPAQGNSNIPPDVA